jgi:hypothetical protein
MIVPPTTVNQSEEEGRATAKITDIYAARVTEAGLFTTVAVSHVTVDGKPGVDRRQGQWEISPHCH